MSKIEKTNTYVCGIHSIEAALKNRKCYKIFITKNFIKNTKPNLVDLINKTKNLEIHTLEHKDLTQMINCDLAHQGCILEASKVSTFSLSQYLSEIEHSNVNLKQKIVILDQITDSHNLGAIIRSCAAFEIDSIIIPNNNSADFNNISTVKAACGGIEYIKLINVTNIAQTISHLKTKDFWCVGLDEKSNTSLNECKKLNFPKLAMVFGAERKGIRSLVLKSCDLVCKINTANAFKTLNVSNAVAVTIHHLR